MMCRHFWGSTKNNTSVENNDFRQLAQTGLCHYIKYVEGQKKPNIKSSDTTINNTLPQKNSHKQKGLQI